MWINVVTLLNYYSKTEKLFMHIVLFCENKYTIDILYSLYLYLSYEDKRASVIVVCTHKKVSHEHIMWIDDFNVTRY